MRRIAWTSFVAAVVLSVLPASAQQVTIDSLLTEMIDRHALSKFPDPYYTCKQFSSYDRASTSPDNEETWFANGDAGKFLRVDKNPAFEGGEEFVMMETEGPGAIVRFWSANPTGTIRFYIDGAAEPALKVPLADLLNGKWQVAAPLSQTVSRGWNLYFPIPYSKSIKVTLEGKRIKEGDREFNECYRVYYQINYRTYEKGTQVESYSAAAFDRAKPTLDRVQTGLTNPESEAQLKTPISRNTLVIEPGESKTVDLPPGPGAVRYIAMGVQIPDDSASKRAQALRSLVISMEFDGEQTVWCPLSDFFGGGVGHNIYRSWYTSMLSARYLHARWIMPYKTSARGTITNLGDKAHSVNFHLATIPYDAWDDRSMHFHCRWRYEYPIQASGARGTQDWNYIEIQGKGVYVGDALSVMNPVNDWWGEGDEKIYVDGETFPSHFGTGTEDYYGYAWCSPDRFEAPFHAQPRSDGMAEKNNRGYTTVMRSRALDAIPFQRSFKFDMEVWHWKSTEVAYAATTWFYAFPGATTNRVEQPEAVSVAILEVPPPPPPFKIEGAMECEGLKVVSRSNAGVLVGPQSGFGPNLWSGDTHLWVQGKQVGDFVEIEIPAAGPSNVKLYATRSWDYGVVRFSVNGEQVGQDVDLYNSAARAVASTGPLDLGVITPKDGKIILKAEVVGSNPKAEGTKAFFGLDCVVLSPPN